MQTKVKEFAEEAILRLLTRDLLPGELKIQISIKMVPEIVEALIAEFRKLETLDIMMDNKMILSTIDNNLIAICPKCGRRTFGFDLFKMHIVKSIGEKQMVVSSDPDRPGPITVYLKGECASQSCDCGEMVIYWGQFTCSELKIKPCYFCGEEIAETSMRSRWKKRRVCPWCGRRQPDAGKENKPPDRPTHE